MEIGLLVLPVEVLDFRLSFASKYMGSMTANVWIDYKLYVYFEMLD